MGSQLSSEFSLSPRLFFFYLAHNDVTSEGMSSSVLWNTLEWPLNLWGRIPLEADRRLTFLVSNCIYTPVHFRPMSHYTSDRLYMIKWPLIWPSVQKTWWSVHTGAIKLITTHCSGWIWCYFYLLHPFPQTLLRICKVSRAICACTGKVGRYMTCCLNTEMCKMLETL